MSAPWRGDDPPKELPQELENALCEWRAQLEPTPAELAASFLRVRQTLSGLPPVVSAPSAPPTASSDSQRQSPGYPAGRWRRMAADCRRAAWAISSSAAVALIAGFALGWLSSGGAFRGTPPQALVSVVERRAEAPVTTHEEQRSEEAPASEAAPPLSSAVAAARVPPPEVLARRGRSADSSAALNQATCQRRGALQRADCWLRREQPRRALGALPRGSAGQEREREQIAMLRLVAECQLGRDIRGAAVRFFAEWPDSPLGLRIRNECPGAVTSSSGLHGSAARTP